MGEMVITAPREPVDEIPEMVITAPRERDADMGEMVITAPREPAEEIPEMVITAPRITDEDAPKPEDEADMGEIVVTAPKEPAPKEPTPKEPTPKEPPPKNPPPKQPPPKVPVEVVKKVAKQLGVPANSQIAMEIAEALYGTMEYLDIGEDFEPSTRKTRPAATQKQLQQTKMAQGGYLDNLLAENMSVDDLLKLLR
jgi:outer membrane biosynthesis protein TonB